METIKYEFANFYCRPRLRNINYPTHITILLTKQCNLDCKFCSANGNNESIMDVDFCEKLLLYCKENGIINVCFSGGEPTIYPHINRIISFAKSLKLNISLVTNGTLLNNVNDYILCNINTLGISLHGPEYVNDYITGACGSYRAVMDSLERIKKYNLNANINYTFSKINNQYGCVRHVANISKQYGLSMTVARINRAGRALDGDYDVNLNIMLDYVQKLANDGYDVKLSNCLAPCGVDAKYRYLTHGCSAGISSISVEPNGDVKLCSTASFSIGNLYSESLYDVWNNRSLLKMRELKWLPIVCKTCIDVMKCHGGCKIENYDPNLWPQWGDSVARNNVDNVWGHISRNKLFLTTNLIRKDNAYYLILGQHLRLCSKNVTELLKLIDGTRTGNNIVSLYDDELASQLRLLLVALYRDSIITTISK